MSELKFTLPLGTTKKLLEMTHIYPNLTPHETIEKSFEDTKKLCEIYAVYMEMADPNVPRDKLIDLIEKQISEDCQSMGRTQ